MKATTTTDWSLGFFRAAIVIGAFIVGHFVHKAQVWPHAVLAEGYEAAVDLTTNLALYAGFEPGKHLFPSARKGQGVTFHDRAKAADGYIFMSGLFDKKNAMMLIGSDGRLVNKWNVNFSTIFKDQVHIQPRSRRPASEWLTHIHGAMPLSDGSAVFNFEEVGLVRVDRCSRVMWTLPRMTHHSIDMADDGTMWVPSRLYHTEPVKRLPLHRAPFFEYQLLNVSQDGKVLREISLPEVLIKNGLAGLLLSAAADRVEITFDDYMHANDAEVLTKDKAAAFPDFAAGDIVVSLRQANTIFVFDPVTQKVKWHQTGPWWRQHDPDFLPNGKIAVFDNRTDDTLDGHIFKGSHISQIDPRSRAVEVVYKDQPKSLDTGFYTYIMGKQQFQPNGNILISQPTHGRAFEVTAKGELAWEYINRFDANRVALLTEASRYPESYFNVPDWTCKPQVAAK